MSDVLEKILVVDDDPNLAELIVDFCGSMGYPVKAVTSSDKVVAEAREWKPSLITLDLQMPGIDGYEVLRRLKADPQTCHIPVIIISVLAKDGRRRSLLAAAQAILSKPIDFRVLRERVDHFLREKAKLRSA